MLGQIKKNKKKEMKEDRLITFYYKAITFFEEQKQKIFIGLGIVALAAVGLYFYSTQLAQKNEKANLELSRIFPLYEQGLFLEAIEGRPNTQLIGLRKIVELYDGSENGEKAQVFLGNAYFFLGNFDEAMNAYEGYSGDNEFYRAAAIAGRAGVHESRNELEKAAELFVKASTVSETNVLNPQYLINAGINYLNLGNKQEAKELFDRIKKDYSNSVFAREIERYLAIVQ
ncbi:MAG: hypothetical protein C0425_00735 [Chlorobiaceae bacterium]|nr:hypothetical protein [Chlorobiaceae bacterium]MBA4308848.1 hypothetical protein [Chlorobiaceae bacterium]